MNRGIMLKAFRETWPSTLLLGLLLMVVEGVLAYVLPTFASHFEAQVAQLRFVQTIIQATIGADLGKGFTPEVFQAIAWVHPAVLALTWAHAILAPTRVPAGEIDRGTIDVLLGLPVSRWSVYASESVVWVSSGVLILLLALAGNQIGAARATAGSPDPSRALLAVMNLAALYLAVAGCACFFAAISDRRGRAMTAAFVVVLVSFLLNYLAQLWEPARRLAFLSVLEYYRPLTAIRDGVWPWKDELVLLAAGATLWGAGAVAFVRRDLSTI